MACQKQTETLEGFDGLELYSEIYPCPEPKGVIIALHDYGEHTGLYEPILARLVADSYLVYAMDLRGHGRSPGDRGFIADFDDFLDDLDIFLARIRDRLGNSIPPPFLLGEGMGATIAARFALTRKPRLSGLILCSPLLDLPLSSWERKMVQLSARWMPHAACASAAFEQWRRAQLQTVSIEDPLAYRGPVSVNTVRQILRAGADLKGHSYHIPFPLLTLLGEEADAATVRLTHQLHEAILCVDKQLLNYEKMGSKLLLHRERDQVVGDLIEWCERQRTEPLTSTVEEDEEEDEEDDSL